MSTFDEISNFLRKPRGILGTIRSKRLSVKKRIDQLALTIDGDTEWFLECLPLPKNDIGEVDETVDLRCRHKENGS